MGGEVSEALWRRERNWLGKMGKYKDVGLCIQVKDVSHKARSTDCFPCPLEQGCEEGALHAALISRMGPRQRIRASVSCHPSLCDQYAEKDFLHPASSASRAEGRESREGLLS